MTNRARKLLFPEFKLYKPKDHHPDWDQLNKEAAELAIKILKNAKLQTNFLQGTLFQKRKLTALLRTLRNMLGNKRKMAKGNHNFMPLFYIWTMTNNCNFRCTYCSNHRGGLYPDLYNEGYNKDLTTDQGKQLLKVMKRTPVIYWCGGEPTIRKDLPELLDYASKKYSYFNFINTNGSLIGDQLAKPQYRNFLFNMDVVIISLDSLTISQLSDMYKVGDSVSRKVLRNILTLKILQNYIPFKLSANTVITKDTIGECNDILDFCNDLGITFSPVSANIDHHADYELLNNPEYKALVKRIIDRAEEGYPMIASPRMLRKVLDFKGFKCSPVVFDHVDYTGEMFWPCKAFLEGKMINLLNYKSVKKAHKAAGKLLDPSFFHGKGPNQCGGDCAWMQNCVTDTYAEALRLGFLESGILKEMKELMN